MQPPAHPLDESQRIHALHALCLLDTDAEERFDRLTRLARNLFGVPIALVSLVDINRQWFKSRQGLDACETSREISFCGHAILGREVFVVENASTDPRFADNPLVTSDPNIGFYAGAPLIVANKHAIGTLCVIHHKPRRFSAEDHRLLQQIARMVEDEIAAVGRIGIDETTQLTTRRGFAILAQAAMQHAYEAGTGGVVCIVDHAPEEKIASDPYQLRPALAAVSNAFKEAFGLADVMARLGPLRFGALHTGHSARSVDPMLRQFQDSLMDAGLTSETIQSRVIELDRERHSTGEALLTEIEPDPSNSETT